MRRPGCPVLTIQVYANFRLPGNNRTSKGPWSIQAMHLSSPAHPRWQSLAVWAPIPANAPSHSNHGSPTGGRPVYLSEREDNFAAASFLASKADVTVGGKHPPGRVTAAERGPEGAVQDGVQLLPPRQPEEGPEELVLCPGFQVPGEGGRGEREAGIVTERTRLWRKTLLTPRHNLT